MMRAGTHRGAGAEPTIDCDFDVRDAVHDPISPTTGSFADLHFGSAVLPEWERQPVVCGTAVKCPFCRSTDLATDTDGRKKCLGCGRFVLYLGGERESGLDVAVPAHYSRYRAIRLAGRGGMGIVMHGVDEATGNPVAIKLLIGRERIGRKAIVRFHREVAALRNIFHPNIVRLLSHGAIGNQRFLVMDWVAGPTFRDLIAECRRRRELPRFETARQWLTHACAGLDAIHAAGVLHRDIKPSNLLLENSASVRIADFGIACLAPRRVVPSVANDALIKIVSPTPMLRAPLGEPLTEPGEFSGTAQFIAPECLYSGAAASVQSDLYSLGVTFFEIVTGERPLISWPPPSALNHLLPKSFDIVMMRLLAKSPSDRYSSAKEVQAALGRI